MQWINLIPSNYLRLEVWIIIAMVLGSSIFISTLPNYRKREEKKVYTKESKKKGR